MEARTKTWEGEIPVHYLYTYGLAGEKFFREIKDRGVFVATRCDACNVTYLPPRIYCERCFAELNFYHDVGKKGSVETFTICHEAADGSRLEEPQVIAYIRIAGTDGGIIHKIANVREGDIKIGMNVEAVFAEPSKRTGSITDILYFRP